MKEGTSSQTSLGHKQPPTPGTPPRRAPRPGAAPQPPFRGPPAEHGAAARAGDLYVRFDVRFPEHALSAEADRLLRQVLKGAAAGALAAAVWVLVESTTAGKRGTVVNPPAGSELKGAVGLMPLADGSWVAIRSISGPAQEYAGGEAAASSLLRRAARAARVQATFWDDGTSSGRK